MWLPESFHQLTHLLIVAQTIMCALHYESLKRGYSWRFSSEISITEVWVLVLYLERRFLGLISHCWSLCVPCLLCHLIVIGPDLMKPLAYIISRLVIMFNINVNVQVLSPYIPHEFSELYVYMHTLFHGLISSDERSHLIWWEFSISAREPIFDIQHCSTSCYDC